MTNIAIKFIEAKHSNASKQSIISLRKEAASELKDIKNQNSDVFDRYKGVHGRFQQSQLDVLDIREYKMCAIIDQMDAMISAL